MQNCQLIMKNTLFIERGKHLICFKTAGTKVSTYQIVFTPFAKLYIVFCLLTDSPHPDILDQSNHLPSPHFQLPLEVSMVSAIFNRPGVAGAVL